MNDFLLRSDDFLLKNVEFIIQSSHVAGGVGWCLMIGWLRSSGCKKRAVDYEPPRLQRRPALGRRAVAIGL